MKRFISTLLICASCFVESANATNFWHSGTIQDGEGICIAIFSFDGWTLYPGDLQVGISAIDKAGKEVASGVLIIKDIDKKTHPFVATYPSASFAKETLCDDNLTFVVTQASAITTNGTWDALGWLNIITFKPSKIRIAKPHTD